MNTQNEKPTSKVIMPTEEDLKKFAMDGNKKHRMRAILEIVGGGLVVGFVLLAFLVSDERGDGFIDGIRSQYRFALGMGGLITMGVGLSRFFRP